MGLACWRQPFGQHSLRCGVVIDQQHRFCGEQTEHLPGLFRRCARQSIQPPALTADAKQFFSRPQAAVDPVAASGVAVNVASGVFPQQLTFANTRHAIDHHMEVVARRAHQHGQFIQLLLPAHHTDHRWSRINGAQNPPRGR